MSFRLFFKYYIFLGNEVENNKNEDQEEVKKFAGDVAVAIRCLAVTDEICADFTERGATENLIKLMDAYGEDPRVCSRCCLALKMISNNDGKYSSEGASIANGAL